MKAALLPDRGVLKVAGDDARKFLNGLITSDMAKVTPDRAALVEAAEYEAHRIALAIPRGGVDFAYGDAFPHETDMDQLNGVDFEKGCFVGQEVVSRIEHRGTARNRVVGVRYRDFSPEPGV